MSDLVIEITLGASAIAILVCLKHAVDRVEYLTRRLDSAERGGIETARLLMKEREEHSDKILFFKRRVQELAREKADLLERCGESTPTEE